MVRPYPQTARDRDRWILNRRGPRNHVEAYRPYACFVEQECSESGDAAGIATIFLTNRECPLRCLMCDLWKNTLAHSVPRGAIPAQIDFALQQLATSEDESRHVASLDQIKLYNSGSFFDRGAIPADDYEPIAERVRSFERVIVECHPSLVGESVLDFRDLLQRGRGRLRKAKLEIAMGLETAHADVLAKLNKRMSLDQFRVAAEFLKENQIALRVFILVRPPFMSEIEGLHWAKRSLDFAFDCGATVASLIPTRAGNGGLEVLAQQGEFSPPTLATLEAAITYGIGLKRGRVFADLWDLEKFSACRLCFEPRKRRLERVNLQQKIQPEIECPCRRGSPNHL